MVLLVVWLVLGVLWGSVLVVIRFRVLVGLWGRLVRGRCRLVLLRSSRVLGVCFGVVGVVCRGVSLW